MSYNKGNEQGGATLTEFVNRPLFLGQSVLDLMWAVAGIVTFADISTAVINGSGAITGAGSDWMGAESTAKLMGIELLVLFLSVCMVLIRDWRLEKLVNTIVHMIMFAAVIGVVLSFVYEQSPAAQAAKNGIGAVRAGASQVFSYNANVAQPDNCKWFNTAKNKWLPGDPNDETTQAGWCNKTRHADCVCK